MVGLGQRQRLLSLRIHWIVAIYSSHSLLLKYFDFKGSYRPQAAPHHLISLTSAVGGEAAERFDQCVATIH
jgi:hypothetical protein